MAHAFRSRDLQELRRSDEISRRRRTAVLRRREDPPDRGDQAAATDRRESVMANQSTIDKLAKTNPGAMEFDAAVAAIRWLQMSPEMPTPTIHVADFGETIGIALQWTDAERTMWCRAAFRGDGEFDWITMGPPLDEDDSRMIDDDSGNIPVERGAPRSMVDYLNVMLRESA
jgi:hypothetical protein